MSKTKPELSVVEPTTSEDQDPMLKVINEGQSLLLSIAKASGAKFFLEYENRRGGSFFRSNAELIMHLRSEYGIYLHDLSEKD